MTLKDYLAKSDDTIETLAAKTGLSTASISRISRSLQKPSHDAIQSIVTATGGKVKPNDFFGVAA